MHSTSERYRRVLSRILVVILLIFILSSESHWKANHQMIAACFFFMGIILSGIASLGRMWCSLYIAGYKDGQLITAGPYSLCRNPLYFFSMIGILGIGLATKTLTIPIVLMVFFALYHPLVIKGEESRLKELFGDAFEAYTKRVPRFFPSFSTFSDPAEYLVKPIVYREHIFSAIWFIWLIGVLEVIGGMRDIGLIPPLWSLY